MWIPLAHSVQRSHGWTGREQKNCTDTASVIILVRSPLTLCSQALQLAALVVTAEILFFDGGDGRCQRGGGEAIFLLQILAFIFSFLPGPSLMPCEALHASVLLPPGAFSGKQRFPPVEFVATACCWSRGSPGRRQGHSWSQRRTDSVTFHNSQCGDSHLETHSKVWRSSFKRPSSLRPKQTALRSKFSTS